MQRFGGDARTRRKLVAERKRLRTALKATPETDETAAERTELVQELKKLRAALAQVKTTVQITEPKSSRSRRTIALPAVAVSALRAHRVRQLEARLAAGSKWRDGGFVFPNSIGSPLDPRNVTRQFKALLVKASLPSIRLHDLRHSCATHETHSVVCQLVCQTRNCTHLRWSVLRNFRGIQW